MGVLFETGITHKQLIIKIYFPKNTKCKKLQVVTKRVRYDPHYVWYKLMLDVVLADFGLPDLSLFKLCKSFPLGLSFELRAISLWCAGHFEHWSVAGMLVEQRLRILFRDKIQQLYLAVIERGIFCMSTSLDNLVFLEMNWIFYFLKLWNWASGGIHLHFLKRMSECPSD